jgi:hypothetical protein
VTEQCASSPNQTILVDAIITLPHIRSHKIQVRCFRTLCGHAVIVAQVMAESTKVPMCVVQSHHREAEAVPLHIALKFENIVQRSQYCIR